MQQVDWGSLSNEDLLVQYGNGHFQAFDTFYRRNSKSVFLYILSRVRVQSEAEDILQESFMRLHKYIHRYDPRQSAMTWLFSIARNRMFSHLEKRADTCELDESVWESQGTVSIEARNELEHLLRLLTVEECALLTDRFVREESYEELSQKRGLSVLNARQKVSRLLKKLRSGS